jgi:DNA/RNA-binding domain of Phe-tRNA-synthetase-like protein
MLSLTDKWKATYPGAGVGVLEMCGVANPESSSELDQRAGHIEQYLRERYSGADRATIKTIPSIQAYSDYYRQFKKTYHVQLQLESVLLKGKSIPGMRALIKAMVSAELKNHLLTAGHDVELLDGSLTADVATGEELYTRFGDKEQQLKQGDMFIADGSGIVSSVIYGPDARTSIRENTEHVCFTVYVVPGIAPATVKAHLADIRDAVMLVSPGAEVEMLEFVGSESGSK